MRQVVLDTETTGLEWKKGNRVVEIGCVELVERRPTGRTFHCYLNPDREFEPGAQEVTGLTLDFLADKPRFAEVVDEFLAFVEGAELVIHNAAFDVGFLNNELGMLGKPVLTAICPSVIDTLKLAKEQNPGKKASLDALCDRYEIDNAHRELHGALLDAELLAEVYLAMTRGQESLIMALDEPAPQLDDADDQRAVLAERAPLRVLRATADELEGHAKVLGEIAKANKGHCLWLPPEPAPAA